MESDLEAENCKLIDRVTVVEAENDRLNQQIAMLEKALDKQKKLHRKFAEDVVESERIRNQDFRCEKQSLKAINASLDKENRQLVKDVSFYKTAYEELVKEDQPAQAVGSSQRLSKQTMVMEEEPVLENNPARPKRASRTIMSAATQTSSSTTMSKSECNCSTETVIGPQIGNKQKSSKVLTKLSEKLFTENKKLTLKINSSSATILHLKKNIRKLETIIEKSAKQKTKVSQDLDDITLLVNSTLLKNKDTFNSDVLKKLQKF